MDDLTIMLVAFSGVALLVGVLVLAATVTRRVTTEEPGLFPVLLVLAGLVVFVLVHH